ncbi:MAG: hypothetical protein IKW18_06270 [Clostridia bacterium]|nr:hypothetical protein [Clostridia bacterium]
MMTLQEIINKHHLTEQDLLCFLGIGTARAAELATRDHEDEKAKEFTNISKDIEKVLFNRAITNH